MNMKSLAVAVLAVFAALASPTRARAVVAECDQLAGAPSGMGLCVPRFGTDGDMWGQAIIDAFTQVNSSGVINSTASAPTFGKITVSTIAAMTDSGVNFASGPVTMTGLGGLSITYGVSAATGAFSLGVTAASASLSGSGAAVYSLTTSSGIHVLNGRIRLESGAYIQWADLTTSTTGAPGSGSAVVKSSWSAVTMCGGDQSPAATTKATAEAVTGSTITITIQTGSMVEACVAGSFNTASAEGGIDIRIDGVSYTAGGTKGITLGTFGTSIDTSFGQCVPLTGLSAAQHNFTLNVWRGGNPVTLRKGNPCLTFSVKEFQLAP